MPSLVIKFLRGGVSLALFFLFGVGAIFLTPIVLVLRRPEWCQPIVRALWRPLVWLFVHTGLIRLEYHNLCNLRGTIIVSNHPSLIDVVLLVARLPRTLYVAKRSLLHNPILSSIVGSTTLPASSDLLDSAQSYLARGWNVLIFPEGTRSPKIGMHPFHRGAAHLALRSGAPVVCVGISQTRRLLAKHQYPWDMNVQRVLVSLVGDCPKRESLCGRESERSAARRLTAEFESRVLKLISK